MAGSFRSTLRRSMFRFASLPITISDRLFNREASSAFISILDSFTFNSIVAVEPLKSKRCASSLRAWLIALSISCLSTSETMSKLGMPARYHCQRECSQEFYSRHLQVKEMAGENPFLKDRRRAKCEGQAGSPSRSNPGPNSP